MAHVRTRKSVSRQHAGHPIFNLFLNLWILMTFPGNIYAPVENEYNISESAVLVLLSHTSEVDCELQLKSNGKLGVPQMT